MELFVLVFGVLVALPVQFFQFGDVPFDASYFEWGAGLDDEGVASLLLGFHVVEGFVVDLVAVEEAMGEGFVWCCLF